MKVIPPTPVKPGPNLIPVAYPVVGNKYHTSWSKNPWMTWTLVRLESNSTCILASKLSRFETNTADLRMNALQKKHTPKAAKQLELAFFNTLQL